MAEPSRQRPELLTHRPAADQIVIDDLSTDQRWPELAALVRNHVPVRSAVLQFIVVEGRYAAVMPVYDDRLSYFTAMHQHALRTLAEIAGLPSPVSLPRARSSNSGPPWKAIGRSPGRWAS